MKLLTCCYCRSFQVLETCVKNCGKRFHIQVANKDFLNELVKIIAPKNEPTVGVQEKILSLIQVKIHKYAYFQQAVNDL